MDNVYDSYIAGFLAKCAAAGMSPEASMALAENTVLEKNAGKGDIVKFITGVAKKAPKGGVGPVMGGGAKKMRDLGWQTGRTTHIGGVPVGQSMKQIAGPAAKRFEGVWPMAKRLMRNPRNAAIAAGLGGYGLSNMLEGMGGGMDPQQMYAMQQQMGQMANQNSYAGVLPYLN